MMMTACILMNPTFAEGSSGDTLNEELKTIQYHKRNTYCRVFTYKY